MIESMDAIKATLTREGGEKVCYSPAAILMYEDEQYLIMRADEDTMIEDEVLLLRIEQGEAGTKLHVVEDQRPFMNAIKDTLGLSNQIH